MRFEKEPELIRAGLDGLTDYLKKVDVGFDMDGTEVFSLAHAIQKYNRKYPENKKTMKDITVHGSMGHWVQEAEEMNGNKIELDKAWDISSVFWNNKSTLTNSSPVNGAVILSKFLDSKEIKPWRITSRPSFTKDWTVNWYRYWMPWVLRDTILVQESCNHINPKFKIERIKEKNIKFFFEDGPKDIVKIADETDATVIVVPQSYNLGLQKHPQIILPWNSERNTLETQRPAMFRSFIALAKTLSFI